MPDKPTKPTKHKRIGFRVYDEEPEVEPMKQIDTTEQTDEEQPTETPTVLLDDYIPGAVYDAQGNIVTKKSFDAAIKKVRAEARKMNLSGIAKLIFYTALAASLLQLSYGVYNKYLKTKPNIECQKTK